MPAINYQHFANENKELRDDNRILEIENEDMRCKMLEIVRELSLTCSEYEKVKAVIEKHWRWFRRVGG